MENEFIKKWNKWKDNNSWFRLTSKEKERVVLELYGDYIWYYKERITPTSVISQYLGISRELAARYIRRLEKKGYLTEIKLRQHQRNLFPTDWLNKS